MIDLFQSYLCAINRFDKLTKRIEINTTVDDTMTTLLRYHCSYTSSEIE